MNVETVQKDGRAFVLVPIEQYTQLIEDAEMLQDILDFRTVKATEEERFPGEVVNRLILNDENPIKVHREYRGLTQAQLAETAGIARAYLAELEAGRKAGSIKTLKAIAAALSVDVDEIVS
jgi:DNA-binding XRE family transcriptional regulator